MLLASGFFFLLDQTHNDKGTARRGNVIAGRWFPTGVGSSELIADNHHGLKPPLLLRDHPIPLIGEELAVSGVLLGHLEHIAPESDTIREEGLHEGDLGVLTESNACRYVREDDWAGHGVPRRAPLVIEQATFGADVEPYPDVITEPAQRADIR